MSPNQDKAKFEAGLKVRKEVIGEEYVTKALANATDFTMPFQEFMTEYCWEAIWTRPGIPRKMRSMLNLAILTALNRPNEFKLHVKGAIRNGCTKEEIFEVLLQSTVYCGVPAGVEAFRLANEVLAELSTASSQQ